MRTNIQILFFLFLTLVACSSDDSKPPTRSYRMGFQNSAPRYDDFDLIIQSLLMWSERADAAMITTEVPWEELLAEQTQLIMLSTIM
jgi:hypothetical protein